MKISFIEELNKNLVSEEYKEECKKAGRLFSKSKGKETVMNKETIARLENKIKKAQEEIKQARAQIKRLKKEIEKPNFKYPKLGDRVWFIWSNGGVSYRRWDGDDYDKKVFRQGGLFLTQEEAEIEAERERVIEELKLFKEPEDRAWDMNNMHYCLAYSYISDEITHGIRQCHKSDDIYFETEEDLYKAVDFVGADRVKKYYLRIED